MQNPLGEYQDAVEKPNKIQELIDLLARQQQEPPLTGQQMADKSTAEGLAQLNQANTQAKAQTEAQQIQALAQQLPPTQKQPLSPLDVELTQLMLDYKDKWKYADAYAKMSFPKETDATKLAAIADSIRIKSHEQADRVRDYAKAAGIDLSGIENVGYEEAADNFEKRKIQELAELLDPRGKYSQTSAEYLDNAYLRAGGQGMSAREAQRFARRRAQEYQSDRVAYLRNAFDVYGVDGNYINGTGVEIINQLAQEMPAVANVYAQAYQLPTDAQNIYNELKNKDIDYMHEIGKIDRTGMWNEDISRSQRNWQSKENALNREYELTKQEQEYSLRFATEAEIKRLQAQLKAQEPNESQKLYDNVYTTLRANGYGEQEASKQAWRYVLKHYVNTSNGKTKGTSGTEDTSKTPKKTEKQQELENQWHNLTFDALQNVTAPVDKNISLLETFVEENGKSFSPNDYALMKDQIFAIQGYRLMLQGKQDEAIALLSRIKNRQVLQAFFPNENWSEKLDKSHPIKEKTPPTTVEDTTKSGVGTSAKVVDLVRQGRGG